MLACSQQLGFAIHRPLLMSLWNMSGKAKSPRRPGLCLSLSHAHMPTASPALLSASSGARRGAVAGRLLSGVCVEGVSERTSMDIRSAGWSVQHENGGQIWSHTEPSEADFAFTASRGLSRVR